MEDDLSKYAEIIKSFPDYLPAERPFTASEIEASNVLLFSRLQAIEDCFNSEIIHLLDGGVGLRKGCSYPEYREEDAIPKNVVFTTFPKKG